MYCSKFFQKQLPEMFHKKSCPAIFTGKNLCWSLQACNFFKKTPTQVVSCEYCKIFKNTILKNTCERLLFDLCLYYREYFSKVFEWMQLLLSYYFPGLSHILEILNYVVKLQLQYKKRIDSCLLLLCWYNAQKRVVGGLPFAFWSCA